MRRLHRELFLSLIALLLCVPVLLTFVFAQGEQTQKGKQTPPAQPQAQQGEEEDYDEKEYEDFQKAYTEPDLAKRADLLIQYLKTGKSNTLKASAILAYNQIYNDYKNQNNYKALAVAAEKFLQLGRDFLKSLDAEGAKAKPEKKIRAEEMYLRSLGMVAEAYENLKDYRKFIPHAEKFYAEKPNWTTAYHIYLVYDKLKDTPKALEWANKTLQNNPDPKVRLDLRLDLLKRYTGQKKFEEAARHAREALKDLDTIQKPENVSKADWDKFVAQSKASSHALLGEVAYEKGRWKEAIAQYENALKYQKCNDVFYYRIGFAYWRENPPDVRAAMHNFAKAYLLKGQTSADAKKRVEGIYKPQHNDTLIGIDKNVYSKAEAEIRDCHKR